MIKMTEGSSSLTEEDVEAQPRRSLRGKRPITRLLTFEDVETESPESVSGKEVVSKRPRGGRKAPVRGGRCSGRRGGRVLRGRQFDEEQEDRLVQLHEERQQQADEMIDRMTEEESKAILKEIAARQPAVILDVAEILSRRRQQEPEPEPGPSVQTPDWCICTRCPPRDRAEDRVCCGMAPQYCTSRRLEMGLVVTDPLTLHFQQTFRNDVFVQQAVTLEDTNKAFRHAAYRQYVLWIYGRLQRDDRWTVPACCVQVIRDRFPSPSGHYTGFIPGMGIGL